MRPNGLIKTNKPKGWTSFDVVRKVRNVLEKELRLQSGQKQKVKVGHGGTLDPFAEGLLLIAFGSATKKLGTLLKLDKSYRGTLFLGATSTTGDPEGDITKQEDVQKPTAADIEKVLKSFEGESEQMPPSHSAIKIDGKRAYELARAGKSVKLTPRSIKIYQIKLISYDFPELIIETDVSSGTYIRSLAEDIGNKLGTGAYLKELTRLSIGDYQLEGALNLDRLSYSEIIEAASGIESA